MGSSPNNMFSSGMPSSLQQGFGAGPSSVMSGPGNQASAENHPQMAPTGYGDYGGMPSGSLGWSTPANQTSYTGFGSAGYSPVASTFGFPQSTGSVPAPGGLAGQRNFGYGGGGQQAGDTTTNNYYAAPTADPAAPAATTPAPAAPAAPVVNPNPYGNAPKEVQAPPPANVLAALFGSGNRDQIG